MLPLIVSVIFTAVGFGIAWFVAGKQLRDVRTELDSARSQNVSVNQELHGLLEQIAGVTTRMDSDVGRHTRQLTDITASIAKVSDQQPKLVADMAHKLIQANTQLRDELNVARQEIAKTQRDLESHVSEARTDTLTGLKNRRSFNEELERLLAQRKRQGTLFSVVMIDVDHFKKFNDTHGHLAGDLVLRSVANVIRETLRDMDMAFRYGGEEFVAICPGSRLHEGLIAAERVRNAIATKLVALKDGPVQVTASMGAAEIHADESGELLLQRADDALYAAKDAGRNRVFAHDGTNCVASSSTQLSAASSV